jgi:D-beta-D-heptose 7-phosphate kinase / D-beta-D-heptose 1-phosphate adenosyltransferase
MTGIVVVGDCTLDVDVVGGMTRIAADAPVPVVERAGEEDVRPGGAALAATLAALSGVDVTLVTALADDAEADALRRTLPSGVRLLAMPGHGRTPVKQRIRVDGRTVLRVHGGGTVAPVGDPSDDIVEAVASAGALVVSDYGAGVVRAQAVVRLLTRWLPGVPSVWDPHPRGEPPVPHTWVVTPTFAECVGALGRPVTSSPPDMGSCHEMAERLLRRWSVRAVGMTLGERGALLCAGDGAPTVLPARHVQADDTCGAGDMFAVATARSLAAGRLPTDAVQDAVAAATDFVEQGAAAGLCRPRRAAQPRGRADEVVDRVRARGGTVVAAGGCFDLLHPGHVRTLQAARDLGDCLVVCLNSDESVRRLKGPGRPVVDAAGRAAVLLGLECVDAVAVFDEDDPAAVLRRLRPDLWVKGSDYAGSSLPESAVLQEWGGRAVVVPYLPGWSTTALTRAAAGARAGGAA